MGEGDIEWEKEREGEGGRGGDRQDGVRLELKTRKKKNWKVERRENANAYLM